MFIRWNDASVRLTGRWSRLLQDGDDPHVFNQPTARCAVTTAPGSSFELAFRGEMALLHFDAGFLPHPAPHLWVSVDGGARVETPVDRYLRNEEGISKAIAWCKASGLNKVYVESFRGGLFIEQELLEAVRDRFLAEGFLVHGCVTPTGLPKVSNNWKDGGCYSYPATQELMAQIFRRTAAVFDTVMIDDFLFTDCTCEDCDKARGERSFADFHSDLMHEMSVRCILRPAHEVNPRCKVIIKYPLWYENFHKNGYETIRQTRDFDLIWAGTETREPDSERWGRYPQTQGFYMMAWDVKLGGGKCMGGWYDPYTTTPPTYLEQARQTILGGAKESMLFCYRALSEEQPGMEDTEALRKERPGLLKLAYLTENKRIVGVSVPKKPDVDAEEERYLSSFYGMLGIPVCPEVSLDENAPSAILGAQALGFAGIRDYALDLQERGVPTAYSAAFLRKTGLAAAGAPVIDPGADNWTLMDMEKGALDALRDALTAPLGLRFRAPTRVALNLYDQDMEVIQNFLDEPVEVELDLFGRDPKARKIALVLSEGRKVDLAREGSLYRLTIPPRTLVVLN